VADRAVPRAGGSTAVAVDCVDQGRDPFHLLIEHLIAGHLHARLRVGRQHIGAAQNIAVDAVGGEDLLCLGVVDERPAGDETAAA